MKEILIVIGSICTIAIALARRWNRKIRAQRKLADEADKDLKNAKENDDPSSFIDGFNRIK